MSIDLIKPTGVPDRPGLASLLALGFRPFFLLAAVFAVVVVPVWLFVYAGMLELPTHLPASAWHAHEMVFGFAGAVLAGFLLTAARNWTSLPMPSGMHLAALAMLWLLGRLALAIDAGSLRWLAVAIDLSFVPTLALVLALPIAKARNWRNLGFVGLLLVLFGANLLFHLGGGDAYSRATRLAVYAVLLIIVLMGGRVIPSFTESALKVRARRVVALEWGSLVSVAVMAVLTLVPGAERAAGVASLIAGLLNGARMLGWRSGSTLNAPILWVLHLGYGWLVVGLMLTGIVMWMPGWPSSAPLHALTVGAIGMLILGMMSRVSLGHTGRMLVVHPAIAVAFGLLALSAAVRAFGPLVWPEQVLPELWVSGTLWTAAFGIFTVVYLPILAAPRVDGKPG